MKKQNLKKAIGEQLVVFGIPPRLNGFEYLVEAVHLVMEDRSLRHHITSGLYPAVTEKFGITPSNAERGMRHAIEAAFGRGDWEVLEDFFGNTVRADKGKPTNAEFISMMAFRLENREEPE